MDQATFFVLLYSLLDSVHCPLENDDADALVKLLATIQDRLANFHPEGKEMVALFQDHSEFICGSDPFLPKYGKTVSQLLEPLYTALKQKK